MHQTEAYHLKYVSELSESKDWAALIRYWMAHECGDALDAAVTVVKERAAIDHDLQAEPTPSRGRSRPSDWSSLAAFIDSLPRNPASPERLPEVPQITETFRSNLRQSERVTLDLAILYLHAALGPAMTQLPAEYLKVIIDVSIQTAKQGHELSQQLGDPAVEGVFLFVLSRMHLAGLRDFGAASDYLKQAVALYSKLAAWRPVVYSPYLATMLNDFGLAQLELGQSEAALESLTRALELRLDLPNFRPDTLQDEVALVLLNIGLAQSHVEKFELSVESFTRALEARQGWAPQGSRPDYIHAAEAKVYHHLGFAYLRLHNLPAAELNIRKALELRRRLASGPHSLHVQDLIPTLAAMAEVEHRLGRLEAAVMCYKEALEIARTLAEHLPNVYKPQVAATLNNLAVATDAMGDRSQALMHLREAAQLYDEGSGPNEFLALKVACWANLGSFLLEGAGDEDITRLKEARIVLRRARDYVETRRSLLTDPTIKQEVQREALRIYELLLTCCVSLWILTHDEGDIGEAIEVGETTRTRNLGDLFAAEVLEPKGAPRELITRFRDIRSRMRGLRVRSVGESRSFDVTVSVKGNARVITASEATLRARNEAASVDAELRHTQAEHDALLSHIRSHFDPAFDPDQRISTVNFRMIRSLIPGDIPTAVLQYSLGQDRSLVLGITSSEEFACPLPELNRRKAMSMAREWFGDYYSRRFRLSPTGDIHVRQVVEQLAKCAVWPVIPSLLQAGIRRLIIVPNYALHAFPLHACRLNDGRLLSDVFDIEYAPSLSILNHCRSRSKRSDNRLVIIENPTFDLPFAEVEGALVRAQYSNYLRLSGLEAQRLSVIRECNHCKILHYAGHSFFDPIDPLNSALLLSRSTGDRLTLREIFAGVRLEGNALTVISGCESGMVMPDLVDEYVGFTGGLLYAGAACVISALWAVPDLSSALLMDRFHMEFRRGANASSALGEAGRWLREDIVSGEYLVEELLPTILSRLEDRDLRRICEVAAQQYAERFPYTPPFESPVHWAGFIASGLAHEVHGGSC